MKFNVDMSEVEPYALTVEAATGKVYSIPIQDLWDGVHFARGDKIYYTQLDTNCITSLSFGEGTLPTLGGNNATNC